MNIYSDITKTIGRTPLVRLNKLTAGMGATVLAKLEGFNPCHSVKDRIGVSMVDEAEKAGTIEPGKTGIIEPTSGNTGIGIAFATAGQGYRLILVRQNMMTLERRVILLADDAQIIIAPDPRRMNAAKANGIEMQKPILNPVILHKYKIPANPKIHRETAGPEI